MTYSDQKIRILEALRDEPLEHAEMCVRLERAPYFVRQDLDDLRRDRLVRKSYERRRIVWALTELGAAEFNHLSQLTLDDAPRP